MKPQNRKKNSTNIKTKQWYQSDTTDVKIELTLTTWFEAHWHHDFGHETIHVFEAHGLSTLRVSTQVPYMSIQSAFGKSVKESKAQSYGLSPYYVSGLVLRMLPEPFQ